MCNNFTVFFKCLVFRFDQMICNSKIMEKPDSKQMKTTLNCRDLPNMNLAWWIFSPFHSNENKYWYQISLQENLSRGEIFSTHFHFYLKNVEINSFTENDCWMNNSNENLSPISKKKVCKHGLSIKNRLDSAKFLV